MRNLSRLLVFFEIFGCTRHSPNKFGSALACTKIYSFTCLLKIVLILLLFYGFIVALLRGKPPNLCKVMDKYHKAQTFLRRKGRLSYTIILYVPRRRYKRNAKTRPFAVAGEAACGHKMPVFCACLRRKAAYCKIFN